MESEYYINNQRNNKHQDHPRVDGACLRRGFDQFDQEVTRSNPTLGRFYKLFYFFVFLLQKHLTTKNN
jgi:hypothetical protein